MRLGNLSYSVTLVHRDLATPHHAINLRAVLKYIRRAYLSVAATVLSGLTRYPVLVDTARA